jgi:hypothetical protein
LEPPLPDKRQHRGPHPHDAILFAPDTHPALRQAAADLSWLFSRGYASVSAVKLVGDRYALDQRQRVAVSRSSCSDEACRSREERRVPLDRLAGETLSIDGYNVLTSVEVALGGGVILEARDGCFRDMASIHGTWRKVQETVPAIELVGHFLADLGVSRTEWFLDAPVSNSGRLKSILRKTAAERGWKWDVELVPDPDRILSRTEHVAATADSGILDECPRWVNLARAVIERLVPTANIVDLSAVSGDPSPPSAARRSLDS